MIELALIFIFSRAIFFISTNISLPIPFVRKFKVPASSSDVPFISIPLVPEKECVAVGVLVESSDNVVGKASTFFNLRFNIPVSFTVTVSVPVTVTVISSKNVTLLSIFIFTKPSIL